MWRLCVAACEPCVRGDVVCDFWFGMMRRGAGECCEGGVVWLETRAEGACEQDGETMGR